MESPSSTWNLTLAAWICRRLNCGSAVLTVERGHQSEQPVWGIDPSCVLAQQLLNKCVATGGGRSASSLIITCSGNNQALIVTFHNKASWCRVAFRSLTALWYSRVF